MYNDQESFSIKQKPDLREKTQKVFSRIKRFFLLALLGYGSSACSQSINENAQRNLQVQAATPIALNQEAIDPINHQESERVITTPENSLAISVATPEYVPRQAKEILVDVSNVHLQTNPAEYMGEFDPVLGQYIRFDKSGLNYCGEATLLNLLDTLAIMQTGKTSELSILEFMNKYFIVDGQLAPAYNNEGLIVNRNGSMSPKAIYGLATKIADEYAYQIQILHGNENLDTNNPPVKKEDLSKLVTENQEFFQNGGIAIVLVSRSASWEAKENEEANPNVKILDFYHYVLVTDMVINPDGSISFLVVDPLGFDGEGSIIYVRMDNNSYTIPDLTKYSDTIYTGIDKIFLLTPVVSQIAN